jgi:hypothetical protein
MYGTGCEYPIVELLCGPLHKHLLYDLTVQASREEAVAWVLDMHGMST